MKKIITVVVAIMMAMSLTSCNKPVAKFTHEQISAEEEIIAQYESGEITIQQWKDAVAELYS